MRIRKDPGIRPGGTTTEGGSSADATATAPQEACIGQVGTVVTRRFPATCASVAAARHFLRQQLGSDGCDPDIESVALMVSELATNAVQHAQTEFEVGIWTTPDADGRSVLVRVTDNAPGRPAPQNPPVDAAHGRGLRIVEALAARWGVEQEEFGCGKTVWFRAHVGPRAAVGDAMGQADDGDPRGGARFVV